MYFVIEPQTLRMAIKWVLSRLNKHWEDRVTFKVSTAISSLPIAIDKRKFDILGMWRFASLVKIWIWKSKNKIRCLDLAIKRNRSIKVSSVFYLCSSSLLRLSVKCDVMEAKLMPTNEQWMKYTSSLKNALTVS